MVQIARPHKPIELCTGAYTKEYKEARQKAELSLVGDRDKLMIPPDRLNDREKELYIEILEPISYLKTLCNADRIIFEHMANAKYMCELCSEIIEKEGVLVNKQDRYGNSELKENPAIKIFKQYENIFRLNATQIGLSPQARAKLIDVKEENESENELNEILTALRN